MPGQDSLLLSLAIAMEKLFGLLPPPAAVAGCSGCQSVAKFVTPTFNGTAQPNSTQIWSTFGFTFNGTCNSSYLTTYGQNGEPRLGCRERHGCATHLLSWLICCTSTSALLVSFIVSAWAQLFLLQLLHAQLRSNVVELRLQAFWVQAPTTSWHPSPQLVD